MAGDWIPLRDNIHDDPDVFRIACSLRVRDTDTIVGKVTRFWAWASEHSRDGTLPGVTFQFVDTISKQKGLGAAMIAAGWLVNDGNQLSIPNFDRWMSKGAKARLGETQRKQMQRGGTPVSGQMSGQVPEECPDKNGTREEKRREEEKPKTGAAAPPFPSGLDREDFRKAWDDYLAYRREAKHKRLQPRSIAALFAEMSAWGPDAAIQAIRTTIAKGWTGIFEPKGEFGRPVKPPPKPGPEKLSDAGQAEFKAWWRERSPEQRSEFARSVGVDVNTVDQNVNWRRVPATWARTGEAEGKQRSSA